MNQTPAPVWTASPQVGTALVLRAFGVERLTALPGWHDDEDTPLGRSADEVARTARRLDHVQRNMVALAVSIRSDMQRVIDGDDVDLPQTHGLLGSTAQSLDLLSARRTEPYQHLDALTQLHKTLAVSSPPDSGKNRAPATAAPAPAPAPEAKLNATQKAMLELVAKGLITVQESGVHRGARMTAPGVDVSPASVNVLIKRKLVDRDTSTSLYAGQRLRLTVAGARVHATLTGAGSATSAGSGAAPSVGAEPATVISAHAPRTVRSTR
ncbi:hypothetical protein [Kitasatospora sp. NPDC057015]|uniref:hypothetical protein n=1 Tax=Kitasatospora sp. NPDC057015 TaxID=3346001 RepID=UPI003632CB2B